MDYLPVDGFWSFPEIVVDIQTTDIYLLFIHVICSPSFFQELKVDHTL